MGLRAAERGRCRRRFMGAQVRRRETRRTAGLSRVHGVASGRPPATQALHAVDKELSTPAEGYEGRRGTRLALSWRQMPIHRSEMGMRPRVEGHRVALGDGSAARSTATARRGLVRFAIAAGLFGLFVGCQNSISYAPIIHPNHPLSSRSVSSVEVFAVTPPSRPHKDIGIFQIGAGMGNNGTTNGMIADARASAARLGCDAILVTSIDTLGGRNRSANIQASCIIYDSAPAVPTNQEGLGGPVPRAGW